MEFLHDEIRQRDINGHFRLCGVEQELAAFQLVFAQERHVSDAESGVSQHENERFDSRAISFAVDSLSREKVACPQYLLEVFVCDWQGRAIMGDWRFDTSRRIHVCPLVLNAEPEKR